MRVKDMGPPFRPGNCPNSDTLHLAEHNCVVLRTWTPDSEYLGSNPESDNNSCHL